MSELHDTDEPGSDPIGVTERLEELEDRVYKLETAVAKPDSPPLTEDAVADRVIAKLSALAGEPRSLPESDRILVLDSTGHPATVAVPPPPQGAVLHPPEPADPARQTWFLTQLAAEVGLTFRMYSDPRYRVSRITQFALPGIALILIFNYYFFAQWVSIPFLSPIVERLLAVFLVIVGYKLLTRELTRYREVVEYLSKYPPR